MAIVLLAAVLRFATLGVQSFSYDELFTTWIARMSFGDLLSTVPETEATPHLFYVLEWLCAQVLGTGEVEMRVLPALAGTLTVPAVYVAGALGASRRVGLATAAVVAVNPFLIWYSQDARAYSLMLLLVALSVMCVVGFARTGALSWLAGWAVASTLALATFYFTVFVILPQAAWILRSGPAAARARVAAVAVPAATALALLPLALHQRSAVGDPGGIGDDSLLERLGAIPKNFLVGFSIPAEALVTVIAAALAAVALALALRSRGDERRLAVSMAALAACGVGLPLLIAPFGFDYVSSRITIAALVPLTILLGCGFVAGRLGPPALGALCLVSMATVIGVAAGPEYQRLDWRGAARELGPARTDRALVFSPPFSNLGPFRVYYGEETGFYRRGMQRPVREVAVVALGEQGGFGPGAPEPPDDPAPRPPPGFRTAEDVETSSYRLVRFTAPRPLRVENAQLAALAFPGVISVFLLQPGGRP